MFQPNEQISYLLFDRFESKQILQLVIVRFQFFQ